MQKDASKSNIGNKAGLDHGISLVSKATGVASSEGKAQSKRVLVKDSNCKASVWPAPLGTSLVGVFPGSASLGDGAASGGGQSVGGNAGVL